MAERERYIGARLTEREAEAVKAYCKAYGISVSSCVRVAVLPDIPPKFWPPAKPPPGQLSLIESTR